LPCNLIFNHSQWPLDIVRLFFISITFRSSNSSSQFLRGVPSSCFVHISFCNSLRNSLVPSNRQVVKAVVLLSPQTCYFFTK
jgi:hypothetical protein